MTRASLIFTVKNEENSISNLLESILYQTKLPDEIIIVDGGSTDNTIKIINQYKNQLPINLIVKKGVNVPEGRNIAISSAKYDYIAATDGGCVLDKNWVYEITNPLKNNKIDVVSGTYIVTGESLFQKLTGKLIMYDFNKVDSNSFSPSSRSIAFRKKAWIDVGGYPEWLISGEDTYFNQKLRILGKKFYLNKKAIVYWESRKSSKKLFKQFFQYSQYDAIAMNNFASYYLRMIFWLSDAFFLITSLFWNLFFLLIIFFLIPFILFLMRMLVKLKKEFISPSNFIISLKILVIFELALVLGFSYGIVIKIFTFFRKAL